MATLSSALNYALAGLSVSAAQSAVVSRNVSSAGDENYSRRTAEIVTLPNSGPVVAQIARSTDRTLLDKLLTSTSGAAGQQVTLEALQRMSAITGDPQDDQSIAAALGKLQTALRGYEQNPASSSLARAALEAARGAAQKLNTASDQVSSIRSEADRSMADSAERITHLLSQFKVVNDTIVRGQGTAGDLTESLDQRDAILKLLSDEIGIRTTVRPNNDVSIYAEGGAVLFEASPRSVSFAASGHLAAGSAGNALIIDGVPVTGAGATMPASGGKLSAYAALRDGLAPQLSLLLDQIAAGLINAFSEADPQLPASLPTVEGLFQGTGALPLLSNPNAGLAGRIRINALADPDQGGTPLLIRDGGFGGPGYLRNATGQAGFQTRIAELADALDRKQSFGNWGGLGGDASLTDYGARSASWVEAKRQDAQASGDAAAAGKSRAAQSLARINGVNIDQEMATLLDLEKSYQASSKVLTAVNSMFDTLLEAVN
ncbi:flagellar hook-associated protein FlgK [Aestuariivirga sp.]|uniref:flagellar hook-associated protein FlgK n=1 Tax=Aestuariivirga sp. TaxID=2650926 RepID=UPI0025BFD4AF|nr:flagellar hook-associated protein FlgK [Aestuariivirga sp.]MCA3554253.1 flagellar hook-associated protein FlgK [Aestuariivirga sp.]